MTSRSTQRTPGQSAPELPALLPGLLLVDPDAGESRRTVRRSPRDWFVDVVGFLVAVTIGAVGFFSAYPDGDGGALMALDLAAGVLSCLSLWWRRRWSVQLAVVVAAISIVSAASGGAAVVLLFTVAVHQRFPVTVVVATWHLIAGLLYSLVHPDQDLSWPASAVFTLLFTVAITAWGLFVRARRQLVLSLQERTRQAEAEAALREEQARHLERERIAREMHDVLAHRISLLSVHAGALEYRPGAPEDDIARAASVIRSSAHQALQDLREIIGVLRAPSGTDDADRPQPTLGQVTTLIDESRQAGMNVTVDDDRADHREPPAAVARCAYRVVQEGLTNARKHARGAAVVITLAGAPGEGLRVEIRNRPPLRTTSHPRIPGAGTGLIGLAERVELVGGRLDHGPVPDGDFLVQAWLPWPP